jgi:large subunit ribosomal protein L17
MRHGVAFKKFGRTSSHRRALFRNMATSLFLHEKYETTLPKAKDLRRVVDRLITIAKTDTLANRRHAYSYLLDKKAVQKLFAVIGPRYKTRPGGYTRILRTRYRHGDSALLAHISLVEGEETKPKAKKKTRAASSKKTKAAPAEKAEAPASEEPSKS